MAKKSDTLTEETLTSDEAPLPPSAKSRESFFGTLLLSFLVLFVLLSLAGALYGAYRLWQKQETVSNAPSITGLADLELADSPQIAPEPALVETEPAAGATPEVLSKAQGTEVIVMNGGGPKGVAGQAGETLKAAGFTKVSVGNTIGNFTGTTVYYSSGLEKEAKAVQEKLATKYPNVAVKAAESANKETSTKPLTVIFGK